MKRAAGFIVRARLLQRNVTIDQIHNINAGQKLIYKVLRDSTSHWRILTSFTVFDLFDSHFDYDKADRFAFTQYGCKTLPRRSGKINRLSMIC